MVCGPIDHSPAGTRHPHVIVLDSGVQLAAVLVLKAEGFKGRTEAGAGGHSMT
jgi:hypothetical protein